MSLGEAILANISARNTAAPVTNARTAAAPTTAPAASAPAANSIADMYQTYLGRAADTGGLDYWTNQLNSGAMSSAQIANAIQNSAEAQARAAAPAQNQGGFFNLAAATPTQSGLTALSTPAAPTPTYTAPTPTVTAAPASNPVAQAYQDYLGRSADQAGLDYWNSQISSGTMTADQVANAIKNSQEAQSKNTVTQAFNTYLGRAPEQAGLDYWTNEINSGKMTPEQVANAIKNSQEGAIYTAPQTVKDAFQTYLGRAPEQAGLDYWTGQITSGAMTPEQVSNAILQSKEATPVRTIYDAYQQYLGRTPEAEGLKYWQDQVNSGSMSWDAVTKAIAGSTEAYNRALENAPSFDINTDTRTYVNDLYKGILGREMSDAEWQDRNRWIPRDYQGNVDYEQLQKDVLFSKEAQDRTSGMWISKPVYGETSYDEYGNPISGQRTGSSAVYIPPSAVNLPGATRSIYLSDNPQAIIDAIRNDPAAWMKQQLTDYAGNAGWLSKTGAVTGDLYTTAAQNGYGTDSAGVNAFLADRAKATNDTAKWLIDNKVMTQDQISKLWTDTYNQQADAAQRGVVDQIHNDDSGFLGLGKVGEQVGDFLEKYQVPIMTAILGGAVLAPAAVGAAGLTAGSAGAAAMTGGVTGLTSAAGALANGADWKNALLSGGLAGLTAGTLHGLGGLGGGAGAIDSGVAGSTVDQASVDAFLSGASGKLTPAELVDYANFFAEQGYNVGNLDMVSSWSPFAQETFQRAVDMGIDPSFAATKIQEGLLDTGVPGSVLDQSSVNAMLQENPEYAQFFKGQGYNVDAAKGLTSVDSIHNQLVSAFDDAYKTNIADLMKVYEPTAQTNVTIYGTEYTTDVPVGSSTITRPDIGTSGGASETSATVAEVGGKIDDAAKIVSDAATKTPETTVKELYKTLLDRAPEAAALEYWSDLIASGASTAGGVAGAIIGSAEFGGKVGAGTGGAGGGTGTGPGTGGGSGPGGSGPGTGPGGSGPGGDVEGPVTEGEPVTEGGAGGTDGGVPIVVPPVIVPPSGGGGGGTETPTTEPTTEPTTTPKVPTPKVPTTPSVPTITLPKVAGSGSGGVLQHIIPNLTADIVGGTGVFEPTKAVAAQTYSIPQLSNIFDLFAPSTAKRGYADGGLVATEHQPEFYSEGGLNNRYVTGNGDGTSDDVPAMLANGEFVIPADVVSALGNGSNDSGAAVLDEFLSTIRAHKQKHDPKELPPDSLGALAYLKKATKKAGK